MKVPYDLWDWSLGLGKVCARRKYIYLRIRKDLTKAEVHIFEVGLYSQGEVKKNKEFLCKILTH